MHRKGKVWIRVKLVNGRYVLYSRYPETTSCSAIQNQIPDPDVGGVPRRRFALGSAVGLLARFELLDNPLESSNSFCVRWISLVLFCT